MTLDEEDVRAIVVGLADELTVRGLVEGPAPALLSAGELAKRLGRSYQWVLDNKVRLGAVPLHKGKGRGKTGDRWGFDPAHVDRLLREQLGREPSPEPLEQPRRNRGGRPRKTGLVEGAELLKRRRHAP